MDNYTNFFYADEAIFSAANIDYIGPDSTSKLRFYYEHIIQNFDKAPGDLYEFGVFRGNSLLATAILLKKMGSNKKVYGFDSFSGFPEYDKKDSLDRFYDCQNFDYKFQDLQKKYHRVLNSSHIDVSSISSSGNFSNTSDVLLKNKIENLGLDNVELIKGNFKETIPRFFTDKANIFGVNLDCDLYGGYTCALENIWEHVSSKTYIHLDEYYSLKFPGARIAVDEFVSKNRTAKLIKKTGRKGEFPRFNLSKI